MKRTGTLLILSSFLLLLLPMWVSAQAPPPPGQGWAGPPPADRPFAAGPGFRGMGPRRGAPGPQGFGMGGRGMFRGPGFGRMQQELGLTDEQRTKLRQQALEGRKAAVRTRADLQIKRMELAELMGADNPDRVQIDRKLREIADLRYAREKSRVDQRLGFLQTLTPEQKAKLKQFRERGFGEGQPGRMGPRPTGPEGQPGPRPTRPERPASPPEL